ncbi:CRP-like cAMP-binding protein [Ancylomarina subtilis]|uniref:CRP-like cAMP-binding protein n=1 Tax=Ancylomarina subtilis TaxID=1639035 RepID=A0A4V2FRR3_9BACT|nr:Crp/Fnr family transcriptional regulator [Ancylomarina subtilis]RZT91269.1 CRP-like cAMP-binding protein [Ancylomarina subtilis]
MENILFAYYERIFERKLSLDEKVFIKDSSKYESFKKKQLLFSSGDANTRHYIVEKGLLRLYIIDPSGKEFNILFAKENQVIGDLSTPLPTSFFLEAIEDSRVFSIDDDQFRKLTDNFSKITETLKRSYIFLQKRFISILSKTAEENYEELIAEYPDLVQRLPQYHISSYLGVTPVFLSQIMAKRARKK